MDGSSSSGPVWLDTVAIGGLVAENQAVTAVSEAYVGSSDPDTAVWRYVTLTDHAFTLIDLLNDIA